MINLVFISTQRRLWLFIAAVVGAAAILLPWVRVSTGSAAMHASVSISGLQGGGQAAFLAFAAAALLSLPLFKKRLWQKLCRLGLIVAAVTALLCIVVAFSSILAGASGGMIVTGTAPGIWLAIAAAIALLLLAKTHGLRMNYKKGLGNISIPVKKHNRPERQPAKTETIQKIADIEKLAALKNNGSITEEEYEVLKAGLL
ncbi:SHOCT domain-containing protein [Foetidibacter luteolus]|uniref:SHOCT domain-containing protein n=1 Tax=Foetidibacter luteolus TaxID=2608880 RepID=UPI00129A161C|nr:SHOCT domain-containing protein [Foetidibacter luteolus]